GRDAQDVDQLVVVAVHEVALEVEHVGEAAGHARAEVEADLAEHRYHAAGHVFAAVVARALHHRHRAGVAHREALARAAGREQLAAGGAVQTGVADDGGVLRGERRVGGRPHHDAATGHALAHAVVRLTDEFDLHAAGVPRAQ